jgi:hypothetical protein
MFSRTDDAVQKDSACYAILGLFPALWLIGGLFIGDGADPDHRFRPRVQADAARPGLPA